VEILEDAGYSVTHFSAKDENLPKILERVSGLVIAAGGDGTICRVATQIKDRESRVAILPLGTANNIARAFGIAGPVEQIAAGWHDGSDRRLDIGVAAGPFEARRFLEAVGVGALAETIAKKIKEEGSLAKQVERGRDAFRKSLRSAKPVKVKLTLDDRSLKAEVLLLEIMNVGFVGPSLPLAISADSGDGKFDVVFVPADRREEMLEWLEEPERREPPAEKETGRHITLNRNGSMLRVGDKPIPAAKGEVLVEIEHPPITILVPSDPAKRKKTDADERKKSAGDV
jgi:diacylglycerol kinase family enzyme